MVCVIPRSKADKNRAYKIVDYCKPDCYFKDIIFDKKSTFETSMQRLKRITNSNQFIIYENNKDFFFNKDCTIVDSIKTNLFDINGYLIR